MAFRLPFTAGCDHGGCHHEITVKARSHEEAASFMRAEGWKVVRLPYAPGEAKVGDPENYRMYCADHEWEH